jgi:hypothetical protein
MWPERIPVALMVPAADHDFAQKPIQHVLPVTVQAAVLAVHVEVHAHSWPPESASATA